MKVFLGLGSNLGDREVMLHRAIEAIDALPCTAVEAVSSIVETEPVGYWEALPDSAAGSETTQTFGFDEVNKRTNAVTCGKFLNCCVRISTAIPPHRLLEALKEIEKKLGRTNEGIRKNGKGQRIYSDRPIDIDILLYGKRRIDRPDLQVPHPRMYERDFVMRPLREIATKLPKMSQKGGKK